MISDPMAEKRCTERERECRPAAVAPAGGAMAGKLGASPEFVGRRSRAPISNLRAWGAREGRLELTKTKIKDGDNSKR